MYVTFLDASKAFDRIDRRLLFEKMIKKSVALFIIKLLVFWYSRQRMFVRWGDMFHQFMLPTLSSSVVLFYLCFLLYT